ncbi:MAG: micrococcal nuclease [Lysobacterales bacterium]|jgi:micrococcal nuclease
MKYIVSFLLVAVTVLLCLHFVPYVSSSTDNRSSITGEVIWVMDGDSIKFRAGDLVYELELVGIDAPELEQSFGNHAGTYLTDLVISRRVTIEMHAPNEFGTAQGELFLDGVSINKLLLEDGFVWARRGPFEDKKWIGLEQLARDRGFGLWRNSDPLAPWDYRAQAGTSTVNGI